MRGIETIVARRRIAAFAGMTVLVELAAAAGGIDNNWRESPYGVHSHSVVRPIQKANLEREIRLLAELGVGWVRLDWYVQSWNDPTYAAHFDRAVALCESYGMKVLPIVAQLPPEGDETAWARRLKPALEKYRPHFPVLEMFNEVTWYASPKRYRAFLGAFRRVRDEVDPAMRMMVSDYDGIEDFLADGGGDLFEVMNRHYYDFQGRVPERFFGSRTARLREAMRRNGLGDRELWITENGWPTHENSMKGEGVFRAGLECVKSGKADWRVLFLGECITGETVPTAMNMVRELPEGSVHRVAAFGSLAREIAEWKPDVIVLPSSKESPYEELDEVVRFVRTGGIAARIGTGMPFELPYSIRRGVPDKTSGQGGGMEKWLDLFRIAQDGWWPNKSIPKGDDVSDGFRPTAVGVRGGLGKDRVFNRCTGLFSGAKLKEGDRLIPLVAKRLTNGTEVVSAGVYRYASDYKGAFLAGSFFEGYYYPSSVRKQRRMAPRACLCALHSGVDKYFWYESYAPETDLKDPESTFGLMHKDYTPKDTYWAYRTLIRMRPAGSEKETGRWFRERPEGVTLYNPRWRTGGEERGAVWVDAGRCAIRKAELVPEGKAAVFYDWSGKRLDIPGESFEANEDIVYYAVR